MALKQHPGILCLTAVGSLLVCASVLAQMRTPAAAPQAKPSAAVAPTAPASLLDHPPQPAKVTLASGKLTIDADNSTLAEILHQVSQTGGMKIDGLQGGNGNQRVFGSYGPGTPRDVLTSLLNGSGYNFLMVGQTPSGVPRQLALTARPAGGVPNPPPQSFQSTREEYEQDITAPTQYPQERETHPTPPPVPARGPNGVRTPEEILQELQRMRQQQNQPQDQQQDEQPN